ncbi:MAG: hypothetical protein LIO86_06675, partial [Lachnospiraceae bacterium]|nr:hypothetical protein [Lachnospiraceae bacterium]
SLLSIMYIYTGNCSTQNYTIIHQGANNLPDFTDVVEIIEANFKDASILVDSDSLYVYFDFQNRIIHSTVYPTLFEEVEDSEELDQYNILVINNESSTKEDLITSYTRYLANDTYTVYVRAEKN